eukprot:scaffold32265_cov72-Phaeocystis_antarctica.AAC.6
MRLGLEHLADLRTTARKARGSSDAAVAAVASTRAPRPRAAARPRRERSWRKNASGGEQWALTR